MTPGHKLKEADFIDRLEDLFDVAHALALDMINEPEDKEFFVAQREKGRREVMGSVGQVTVDKLKRARETGTKEEKRHQKATEEQEALSCTATLLSSSESDNDTNNDSSDIVDKCIPATLDMKCRTWISTECRFVANVRSIVHGLWRSWRKLSNWCSASGPLGIWDGKLMEDLTTKSYVDRQTYCNFYRRWNKSPVMSTKDCVRNRRNPGNCSQNMFGRMGSNQPSWSLVFRHDSVEHGLQSRCMCADWKEATEEPVVSCMSPPCVRTADWGGIQDYSWWIICARSKTFQTFQISMGHHR